MRNFNKVRRMLVGGVTISNPNPYNNGSFEATAISLPDLIALLDFSSMPTLTDTAIERINNFNNRKNAGLNLKGLFKNSGQSMKNALGGKGGGNAAAFGMLLLGFGMANSYMNKDLVNSEGFDKFNLMADGVVSALGAINPAWGAIAEAVQTSINGVNLLGATKSDSFSVDTLTQAQIGGGYVGSYSDMSDAAQKAGKKYGLFNRKGFREASADIAKAKKMDNSLLNINLDNQTLLAMAANTLMNAMNYANKLNGGIDFNNMRIGRLGFKLENLDRCRKIKTTHIVNVDTKRIEEFKPVIPESPKLFKEGGSIEKEWKPLFIYLKETDLKKQKDNNVDEFPEDYIKFIDSVKQYAPNLGDLKPKGYNMFRYWELQGKPLDWEQALTKNMFFKADDGLYHAPSVAWNEKGEGEWMKHKTFPTAWMEKAFYDGYEVVTDEKGNPLMFDNQPEYEGVHPVLRLLVGDAAKESENMRYNYDIVDDGYGNLKYVPKKHKQGGSIKESDELVKLEETNQKNVIPEGALHKNKHHIEHTEEFTQKGIPVIDNDGELQAEVELNEIIFTLEVTKKLEELHKIYKEGSKSDLDKAAIEAGKLLVLEILYNTIDRTGLISKCENGGKL